MGITYNKVYIIQSFNAAGKVHFGSHSYMSGSVTSPLSNSANVTAATQRKDADSLSFAVTAHGPASDISIGCIRKRRHQK